MMNACGATVDAYNDNSTAENENDYEALSTTHLQDLKVIERRNEICTVALYNLKSRQTQDYVFANENEAKIFCRVIEEVKSSLAENIFSTIQDNNFCQT